nr:ribonuclease H-like domain-containing protein [Tanacetum cinerariifolium]
MEQELRLKRKAAERAFEAQAEKDRTLMRLEELRFLATSTNDLDDDDAYWIKKQKRLIKNKMRNDLGDEDDEDEGFYENKKASGVIWCYDKGSGVGVGAGVDNKGDGVPKVDSDPSSLSYSIGNTPVVSLCTRPRYVKNNTWILVLKPPHANVVRSMWLFRHKYHADGSLSRYKARLVANGCTQQAPRAWFQRFACYALRVGFSYNRRDSSLFIYGRGNEVSYLLIYVDDIVLTVSSTALLQRIISSLHQ